MRQINRLIPFLLAGTLAACGGSSDPAPTVDTAQPNLGHDTSEALSATVTFYVPQYGDTSGTLVVTKMSSNEKQELATNDLNTLTVNLQPGAVYQFEFNPSTENISCPRAQGCGRALLNDPNDLNGNDEIDYNEPVTASVQYELTAKPVAGQNQLFFSSYATLLSDAKLDSTVLSLTNTPIYHLSHSSINHSLRAEYAAKGFTYSDIMRQLNLEGSDSDVISPLADAFDSAYKNADYDAWQGYINLVNQYFMETLLDEKESVLFASVVDQVLLSANEAMQLQDLIAFEDSATVYNNELLNHFRDSLGVIRLQEEKYSEELNTQLQDIETLVADDVAKESFVVLAEAVYEVVSTVSPATDSAPGTYQTGELDIVYTTDPSFNWRVTGMSKGFEVNMDVTMPEWRKSAILGDRISGSGVVTVRKGGVSLQADLDDIYLLFDGALEAESFETATGMSRFGGTITLQTDHSKTAGYLRMRLNRVASPQDTVESVIPNLRLRGQFETVNQVTPVTFYAAERTPFVYDTTLDLSFGIHADFDLKGAPDFQLQLAAEQGDFSNLNSAELGYLLGGRVIQLEVRRSGDNNNIVAKGKDGYWLDVKQKGRNFTGGYYYGDKLIGDVKTVRGIPGVLFPDGSFESLF
ncbi:hypothetical protein CWB99_13250 [Pseudoalteromonas rubra]|uniref:Uncharacterized protein n=1 Tax=Pseudoalteromonas rubra TaxID=43658 RepID=A0A5S3WLN8_9GAMM|nr:hypothetical protein [Pseudoalteromonas rubra]TMP27881.1 hypothetical protein CWB99_13250 [Pseudoalteromonas rubra]TMP31158.1 hypothetical protein CWC00_15040 [Pseudoalteromonas rubra]